MPLAGFEIRLKHHMKRRNQMNYNYYDELFWGGKWILIKRTAEMCWIRKFGKSQLKSNKKEVKNYSMNEQANKRTFLRRELEFIKIDAILRLFVGWLLFHFDSLMLAIWGSHKMWDELLSFQHQSLLWFIRMSAVELIIIRQFIFIYIRKRVYISWKKINRIWAIKSSIFNGSQHKLNACIDLSAKAIFTQRSTREIHVLLASLSMTRYVYM